MILSSDYRTIEGKESDEMIRIIIIYKILKYLSFHKLRYFAFYYASPNMFNMLILMVCRANYNCIYKLKSCKQPLNVVYISPGDIVIPLFFFGFSSSLQESELPPMIVFKFIGLLVFSFALKAFNDSLLIIYKN